MRWPRINFVINDWQGPLLGVAWKMQNGSALRLSLCRAKSKAPALHIIIKCNIKSRSFYFSRA